MRIFRDNKGVAPGLDLVTSLVLALAFIAFVVGLIVAVNENILNVKSVQQVGCWITNTLQCTGGIFSSAPSLCSYETLEDPVDTKKLAALARDTWWMYKQGTCDYGFVGDEIFPAYAFTLEKDIKLSEFFSYITAHNRGKTTDIVHSDFAYLEENTKGPTLCFDRATIDDLTLKKDTQYYMIFYDDQPAYDQGDLVLISEDPKFTSGELSAESTTGIIYFFAIGWKEWVVEELTGLEVASDPQSFCINYGPGGVQ